MVGIHPLFNFLTEHFMRKHLFYFILFINLFHTGFIYGQVKQNVDDLKKQFAIANSDTARFKILDRITTNYLWYANQTDSSLLYATAELQLGSKINQPFYLAESYINLGWYLMNRGSIDLAIDLFTKAIHLAQEYHFPTLLIKAYHALSIT